MLSQARALEVYRYDSNTGLLYYRISLAPSAMIGEIAGNIRPDGYVSLSLDRLRLLAHRVIWLMYHGEFPHNYIDHIDRNPSNNRLENLRISSPLHNQRNRNISSNNTSGTSGVHLEKRSGKYRARIKILGKDKHLGLFKLKEDAVSARKEAEREYGFVGDQI